MTDLPAGLDLTDVRRHSKVMVLCGELINATGAYFHAEDGSIEEQAAEVALDAMVTAVAQVEDAAGNVVLALLSLIVATAPEAEVQAWFDNQAQRIAEALDGR